MSIPLPNAGGGKEDEFTSVCPLYDGDASTSGYCNGWLSKNQVCTRSAPEDLKHSCDGQGNFPDDTEAKHK